MAQVVKFFDRTEAEILALTTASTEWVDKAFYYPSDKDYFYRALNGTMHAYGLAGSTGTNAGVGVKLNGQVMGGVKTTIAQSETVEVPRDYDYNTFTLTVKGTINVLGQINIMQ